MISRRMARIVTAAVVVMTAAAAIAMAPGAARAQATDRGAFVLRVGADTQAVERFTRTPAGVDVELGVKGRARVVYQLRTSPDASVTGVEMRAWTGASDTVPPQQHITVAWMGDSARTTIDAGPQHLVQTVHGARGAVPIVNPSALLLEQVMMRARAMGGDSASVPVFVVGTTQAVPARVRRTGADSVVVTIGTVEARARTDAAGRLLGASVSSQQLVIERVANPGSLGMPRPDYSAPAGAPYTAEEVRVPHPGGFRLAGTLTLPRERGGRVPAVVTITGSGQEDRDEAIPMVRGYRIFRQVADTLGRRGIAVLRMDDRGFGASEGDAATATSADFATDIAAAVAYLRTRPEIDPDRIAVVGHSEGGIIGPIVAAADPRLRAAVLIAGPSRGGRRILEYQLRTPLDADTSLTQAQRDSTYRQGRVMVDSMAAVLPWMKWFLEYDPLPTARRVRQPVLILQGATDRQVTADQAPELAAAIRAGGNRDVTVRVFPELNHLMVHDPSGMPSGYASLPSGSVDPQVLGALADWLVAKLGRR
ncbi:alpha/beta hydrolase family protein [Longimicrobium sp.]|uniref:alpha/beta hydrolase family protein n=1 Tax=Longimicrobium sp. TaxID=2029185 RepID=UPI002C2EF54F|nr:alpha/beta fold hydrolase [Longimicrobium sp.]HSU14826.1 alpha/beta fold hydrolase [Longimicrobium sp.]